MSCGNTNEIRIEPMEVKWVQEETECFDFTNATAAGLGGKYVKMYLPTGAAYYAWFDENNTDTDPAVAAHTAIPVDYAAAALPAVIAAAFQTAVNAVSGFTATISGLEVTVTRDAVGEAVDSDATNCGVYLEMKKLKEGKDVDLGLTSGEITLSFSPNTVPVKAHQTGAIPLLDILSGFEVEVSMTLLESSTSLRKKLIDGSFGSNFTPGGGTNLFGFGTEKVGVNSLLYAGRLVMHPANLGATDYTRDICAWASLPVVDSIVFSGEDPETMDVTFKCYRDESRPESINIVSFGDHTQSGIVA